jgi:hypothetical protein
MYWNPNEDSEAHIGLILFVIRFMFFPQLSHSSKNGVFWDVTPFFIVTAVKTSNLKSHSSTKKLKKLNCFEPSVELYPNTRHMWLKMNVFVSGNGSSKAALLFLWPEF